PTLAYLDEKGERLAADTFLEPAQLAARLQLVHAHSTERRGALRRRLVEPVAESAPRATLDMEPVEWVARTLLETADPKHGGWGVQHKFPHPEAIGFALIRWSETGDEAMRKLVLRTLRNMQEGEIHDRVEGGFYRYATAPDWSGPHHEKTLDSNATRAFAYLEAHQALGEASFESTARGVLEWMMERLYEPGKRAFRGSQDADAAYAHLASVEARRRRGAPASDPTIFAGANALAVTTLFKAGIVLRESHWTDTARGTLEFLLEELFDERLGVHHYSDGAPRLAGLLGDQVLVLRALIDATQCTGESRWLEPARAIVKLTVHGLRGENGAFFDTRQDGPARAGGGKREQSILENAQLAEALLRLALLTGVESDREQAVAALQAFAGDYKRHGHFVAGYARAVALLLHPPVHVTIVSKPRDPLAERLRKAALEPYVASCVVQTLHQPLDDVLIARLGLADEESRGGGARAFVQRGRESYAETSDPARLPALMARIERNE
ncbi:MAG TPA: hypothetical protein VM509_15460, partial [Planctomycetota bacterium]|nr:hypothetical protein [Planctomycetota bacterium]